MTRVLLLEDEPLISMLVQDLLEELGYEVLGPAGSTSDALALIEKCPPEAAILDVSLNGETSSAVAEVLAHRQVPFIFATGGDKHGLVENYPEALVLIKPFDLNSLQTAMSALGVPAG